MRTTRKKLVVSGSVLELYSYQNPVFYGQRNNELIRPKKDRQKKKGGNISLSSIYRAKTNLKRRIIANSWVLPDKNGNICMPIFITFTFKENVTDLKSAHKIFTKSMQRFNYLVTGDKEINLKYVSVPEFQKRGAVHYHMILFNLPKLPIKKLKKIKTTWGQGSYRLEKITDMSKMSRYISKYMTKQMADERFFGQKKYLASKDLLKPITILDEATIDEITKFVPKEIKPFENEWESEFTGHTVYQRFVLNPDFSIYNLPLDSLSKIMIRSASEKVKNPRV